MIEQLFLFDDYYDYITSPLYYSGNKLSIFDYINSNIPKDTTTFIDCMGGGFNVGVNVKVDNVVYNEINKYVYELIDMLLTTNKEELINQVESTIEKYNLKGGEAMAYNKLREDYNKNQSPLLLYVLSLYSYCHQIRFNTTHEFNCSVGNSEYNENTKEHILRFKPQSKNVYTLNLDYKDLPLEQFNKEHSVFYFDPPYIITTAVYNDGKRGFEGWTQKHEKELYIYLDELNKKGYKFMLSNVIYHNGKTNKILKEWLDRNDYQVIEIKAKRNEILVKNY